MAKATTYKLNHNLARLGRHFTWDPSWPLDQQNKRKIEKKPFVKEFVKLLDREGVASKWEKLLSTKDLVGTLMDTRYALLNMILCLDGYRKTDEFYELIKRFKDQEYTCGWLFGQGEEVEKTVNHLRDNISAALHVSRGASVNPVSDPFSAVESILESPTAESVSHILKSQKLPTLDDILAGLEPLRDASESISSLSSEKERLSSDLSRITEEFARLSADMKSLPTSFEVESSGELPSGTFTKVDASEVFPGVTFDKDFLVPKWEWDGPHPLVPQVDPHYIFRKHEVQTVLLSIITNERAWVHGHTGSGKTTLIEQVAARLNYPFIRINFDSDIDRMTLIGREVLTTNEEGRTVSKFVDGLLPKAMAQPCIACFDELDFCRPDVSYVMQSALEGNGLRILEDGDRMVKPHPMFRMLATGNTVGQGDEEGMYQGARPQSLAFLDRFKLWCQVDYLDEKQRADLLTRHHPALSTKDKQAILKYVGEHIAAFTETKITQPISPRGMLALGNFTIILGSFHSAVNMVVIDKANRDDRVVLREIVDRVTR